MIRRLQALNRELEELRSREDRRSASAVSADPSLDARDSVGAAEHNFELGVKSVVLNGTAVDSSLIVDAFQAYALPLVPILRSSLTLPSFAEFFLPQYPLIGSISIRPMHESHPLLFWTIVVIVSSHLPGPPHDELFERLRGPYTKLLKEEMFKAPLPLYKIQALLFLCEWPLPVESQTEDPSWLYCGIALQAARFMGLDRDQTVPSLRCLGVASGAAQARANTWIGCFHTCTSYVKEMFSNPRLPQLLDLRLLLLEG